MRTALLIPASPATAPAALELAKHLVGSGLGEVIVAGVGAVDLPRGLTTWPEATTRADALRTALAKVKADALVVIDADPAWTRADVARVLEPLFADEADVVLAARSVTPLAEALVDRLARAVLENGTRDTLSGLKAFRTKVLDGVTLRAQGEDADAELLVKLAAQLFRFANVDVTARPAPRPLKALAHQARTLFKYATLSNDADNEHEGYNTLANMEAGAPNYNAWLGDRFNEYAGQRVLEIGAGIGTITSHLAAGRDHVTALEVDPFYVKRLHNRFRGQKNVEPYHSDVALADWKKLKGKRFDTIVLSNVLEHIPDDGGAVETFGKILPSGGKLLILVPALPVLFGSIDEAVGHFRRYTPQALRAVLQPHGFEVEVLEWMNLVGIPGWFVNGRLLKRRVLPPLQLRLYDQVAPLLARAESKVKLPVGMSLFCVARRTSARGTAKAKAAHAVDDGSPRQAQA